MIRRFEKLLAELRPEIEAQLGDVARPAQLLRVFLERPPWSRPLAARLLASARGEEGETLPVRVLAVLVLQDRLLALPSGQVDEWRFVLGELGLLTPGSGRDEVDATVLRQGYTALDLPSFVPQLQRHLRRLGDLYGAGGDVARLPVLRTLLHLARGPCRVHLSRYLWTVDEVVDEIHRHLRLATGLPAPLASDQEVVDEEAERVLARLPAFEAGVVGRLTSTPHCYWVSAATSSLPNSLVEYPTKTVVLVVKPPGSPLELEIKRTGLRGGRPLSVKYEVDGAAVPPSHRLDGGSILSALMWEAGSAAKIASFYRACHGVEAPVPRALGAKAIHSVPLGDGEVHLLDYLSNPEVFGEGFKDMQEAMQKSVDAFDKQRGSSLRHLEGVVGRTSRFLAHVAPSQMVLADTSSFRLEQMLQLLSGDETTEAMLQLYRTAEATPAEKLLADDLLSEALGVYTPPDAPPRRFKKYLKAAFEIAANRARADATFLELMAETGRFWGTLQAMRSGSRGESFAARNVGLRAVWRGGEWKTAIVFMDHDDMYVTGADDDVFRPRGILPLIFRDEIHIGHDRDPGARTVVTCLRRIYRVDTPTWKRGEAELRKALESSYRRCQKAMLAGEAPPGFFSDRFIERLPDWDRLVEMFLDHPSSANGDDGWVEPAESFLSGRGYSDDLIREYVAAVRQYRGILGKYSFLYRSE